ncbi:MAG: hypothetical protein WBA38_00300 [Gordonia sp. (in: high G+C Gram-positive bacteria)]|uniref:hypothetical protein n=1 Tax=Gordonia sp. (in: high G+C Gram-positive bacteria) TaxID=84139 RepID=UPI003C76DEDA
MLSIVVILAVIVLGLIGYLVFGASSAPKPDSAPASRTTGTTTEATSASSTTTSSPASTRPSPTVAPGSVTYQLTGNGEAVALAYRDSSGRVLVTATGSPWSQHTSVSDRFVEMTAVVVRGPLTCTILHGDKLISSSTSHGGPLRCSGKLPN